MMLIAQLWLREMSLDAAQATLELLLDLGHLIVAAVKPPKTFYGY